MVLSDRQTYIVSQKLALFMVGEVSLTVRLALEERRR